MTSDSDIWLPDRTVSDSVPHQKVEVYVTQVIQASLVKFSYI